MSAFQHQTQLRNVRGIRDAVACTTLNGSENLCAIFTIAKCDDRRMCRDLVYLIDDCKVLVIVPRIRTTKIDNYHVGPGQDLLWLCDEGVTEAPQRESIPQSPANDFPQSAVIAQKGNPEH
jgi:hypothetical protein